MYSAHARGREVLDVEKPTHASGQKVLNVEKPTHASGQKVLDIEKAKYPPLGEEMHLTCASSRKVLDVEIAKQFSPPCKRSQKVDDTEIILSEVNTSRIGHTIKLSAKARDAKHLSDQRLSTKEQNPEIENLIVQLTHLLQNWDTQSEESENTQLDDPLIILATRVNTANIADQDQFAYST